MDIQAAYNMIATGGLMAGMRGNFPPATALDVTRVLIERGRINVFEFTMNSVQAIEAMQATKREYGDDALVGMGTVLDDETAKRVIDAGADFVVAPSFNRAVVERVHAAGLLMIPGVITPTEAVDAWAMGAKLLKIFPIGNLGVDYFKSLRAPLDHINFMANGGMHERNAGEFIKAGAVACGMAAWLTGDGSMPLATIGERAQLLRSVVDAARSGQPVPMRA
jgi:2-dehydro-3-deoxyphosphogluconate aldolase/(4S)-4-hydroxy-2-oxoglutarate aldolase